MFVTVMSLLFLAAGCGGGEPMSTEAKPSSVPVTAEDVERDLKFDARVSDFDTEGNKLIVNVNEHWMSSPAGMQQTAVKRWLTRWQASKVGEGETSPKDLKVIVRFNGDEILVAMADGSVMVAKSKAEGDAGSSR